MLMKTKFKAAYSLCARSLAVVLCFAMLPFSSSVHAQGATTPSLQITHIDSDSFPLIRVSVFAEHIDGAINTAALRLEEDRVDQPLINSQQAEIGIQTAIVIDASRNINGQGNTGDPKLFEMSRSLGRLVQLGLLSAQTDWLAAFGTGEQADTYDIIADWQQDHQGVVNSLIQWRPENRPVITSLFGTVQDALGQFERLPSDANARRSLVIFSDGADIISSLETEDIARAAEELQVRIHTVLLGPPARDSRRNLGRLAELSNGLFVELNAVEDLDIIWESIAAERTQQILTYRMEQAQPRELRVALQLPSGREISTAKEFPIIGARPVEIRLVSPTAEQSFVREGANANTALALMQPSKMPIQVEFNWPDGHPRQFERVEYTIGNDTRAVTSEPFQRFDFPVENLGEGNHTVRVVAIDELGLSSSSTPLSVPFLLVYASEDALESDGGDVAIASAANATEDTAEIASGNSTLPQTSGLRIGDVSLPPTLSISGFTIPLNLQTLGMFVLPLLLLLCVTMLLLNRRKPQNPYFISDAVPAAEPYADLKKFDPNVVTVPAVSAFEMDEVSTEPVRMLEFDVVAHLVLHSGATHLPDRFPLQEGQQVRIGRHSSYSDIILEDTRISRQHATLEWELDAYTIRDEGSAGGTYVNKRRLKVGDIRKLEDGDIINFNEVAYRYEIVPQKLLSIAAETMPSLEAVQTNLDTPPNDLYSTTARLDDGLTNSV